MVKILTRFFATDDSRVIGKFRSMFSAFKLQKPLPLRRMLIKLTVELIGTFLILPIMVERNFTRLMGVDFLEMPFFIVYKSFLNP